MNAVYHLHFPTAIFKDIHTGMTQFTTSFISFKDNVDVLYENMREIASHLVNHLIDPQDDLRRILVKVKQDIRTYSHLKLQHDPDNNNWTFYSIMYITLILKDDFLWIILTISLINKYLQMDLY